MATLYEAMAVLTASLVVIFILAIIISSVHYLIHGLLHLMDIIFDPFLFNKGK